MILTLVATFIISIYSANLLQSQVKPELVIPLRHSGWIFSVAFSPDGKFLISGSQNLILWEVSSGRSLREMRGHTADVHSVAFCQDGMTVISASDDQTLKLWDIVTGREIRTFTGHTSSVYSVSVSPDGKYAVSAGNDKTIRLWNIATGLEIKRMYGHQNTISSVSFSPDGNYIVSASQDKSIKLWNAVSGKLIRTITGHRYGVNCANFSPDGKKVISASNDYTVKVWDVLSGSVIYSLSDFPGGLIDRVSFSPDGKYFIASSGIGFLRIGNADDGSTIRSIRLQEEQIYSVIFSPDGKYIASGGVEQTIKLWNMATGEEYRTMTGGISGIRDLTLSPDGKYCLSGLEDSTLALWDMAKGREIRRFTGHNNRVGTVDISYDGNYAVSGSWDKSIKLWDIMSGHCERTITGHTGMVTSVAFSPDRKYIASGSTDKTMKLWDVATGRLLKTVENYCFEANRSVYGCPVSVVFSRDGNYVISRLCDTIKLLEVSSGRETMKLSEPQLKLNIHNVLHSNGKSLVTNGIDSSLIMWEITTGKVIRKLKANTWIHAAAISPDEKFIVSGCGDYTLQLWDASNGQAIHNMKGHSAIITSVMFSPNSQFIFSGSIDGTIRIWDVQSGKEVIMLIGFNDRRNWIAITPDGHFDGTSEGIKKLFYVQGLTTISVESFYEHFFSPGLIAQVISGVKLPASQLSLDRGFTLPPTVKFLSPDNGAVVQSNQLELTIEATDRGGGIDEIRLYHNGKALSEEQRGMKTTGHSGSTTRKSFSVLPVPGKNVFRVVAFNRERTESDPDEITVELKEAEAVATLYLVAVGINTYKNPKYNLNYGRIDAKAFADAVSMYGKNIFTRIEKLEIFDELATRESIREALSTVTRLAKPQDVFVFYFAGHGVMSDGNDKESPEFYLVPTDVTQMYGNDEKLKEKAISAKTLREHCRSIQAQKQLVVLDACQSGGALEMFAMRGAAEEKAIAQLARSAGVVILAATGSEQFASEFKALGHGVFTYTFLEAIRGMADGSPKDGKVTVNEISAYLEDKVPELTKQYRGQSQFPARYSVGQDFPLGTVMK